MIYARYKNIRADIQPGDVIAFGGRGFLSWIIKVGTWSEVSHVGIVDRVEETYTEKVGRNTTEYRRTRIRLTESTSLPGVRRVGVQRTYLSERIESYRGEVWWLPLSANFRASLDMQAFWAWLALIEGRGYDARQAYLSWSIFKAHEDYTRLFCSELVAGAWKAAGGLPAYTNPAEYTPADIVREHVYSGLYFQLSGDRLEIRGYNHT